MIYVPPLPAEVEDALQLLAMRNGLREVRRLRAEECDAELESDRLAYLRDAKQRSRARRR